MENFIDTNIALGYTFSFDKWPMNSRKFISEHENIIWSNNVKEEYKRKFNEISSEMHMFLSMISSLLNSNENEFVNYYSFEKFVLSNTTHINLTIDKKIKIIEFFWENKNVISNDSPREILIKFDSFLITYSTNNHLRKKGLMNVVKLHDCGLDNYLNYTHLLEKLKSLNVHDPDFKIILDAHDLGLTADVRFVTADYKLYDILKKCDFLKIKEFKSCNN